MRFFILLSLPLLIVVTHSWSAPRMSMWEGSTLAEGPMPVSKLVATVTDALGEGELNEAKKLLRTDWKLRRERHMNIPPEIAHLIGMIKAGEAQQDEFDSVLPWLWVAWRGEPGNAAYREAFLTMASAEGIHSPPMPAGYPFFMTAPSLAWFLLGLGTLWGTLAVWVVLQFKPKNPLRWKVSAFILVLLFILGATGVFFHHRWQRFDLTAVETPVFIAPSRESPREAVLSSLSWVVRLERHENFYEVSSPLGYNGWVSASTIFPEPFPEDNQE